MGQVHYGSATVTAAVRRAIPHGQESLRPLARRYGINRKTVAKWKKRTSVADLPTGPQDPHSSVLSLEEEAIIVTSLLATARHQPVARCRRRQAGEEEGQSLADRRSGIFSDQWRSCPHNSSRQLSAIRDLAGEHFDVLAGVIFDDDFRVVRAALISRDVVEGRSTYVAHTNSHKFILREDVWSAPGVRDVTSEVATAMP